jgi:hypothetical protein
VIKFRFTLKNFLLLLASLAVMDIFLSGYKMKDRDNEACVSKDNDASSGREIVCKIPEFRKYNKI